jgi:Ni,Fe-hydrogenase I small subunit
MQNIKQKIDWLFKKNPLINKEGCPIRERVYCVLVLLLVLTMI